MSNKLWRVVRACVELGAQNPIQQIHDQGAGGNCNVVKEIIYPLGAEIDIRAIKLGDETMSVLEIWGAEYQENDALLIKPESRELLQEVCRRERCNMQVCQPTAFCRAHSQLRSSLTLCSFLAHSSLSIKFWHISRSFFTLRPYVRATTAWSVVLAAFTPYRSLFNTRFTTQTAAQCVPSSTRFSACCGKCIVYGMLQVTQPVAQHTDSPQYWHSAVHVMYVCRVRDTMCRLLPCCR